MSNNHNNNKEVSILLIGDTGTGKSTFGNYYLKEQVFEENDSEEPVTTEVVCKSKPVDGYQRYVIDTEGLNDGQSINAVQIQNLAKFMKSYDRGINVIAIILNGQYDRFSQGVKDIIQFAYNAFGTREALENMCIVFTKCYSTTNPKRETKQTKYRNAVKQYLSEISGSPLREIPDIPIFFVDCKPEHENKDSESQLSLFHGFACMRDPLSTKNFKEAGYREQHFEETRTKFSKGFKTIGDTTYELFEDQKRTKIVPNNKDPARYTEWITMKSYKEAVKKVIFEKKNNVDLGFKNSPDGNIRYKVTVDQERKIVRDLRTGRDIEKTPWYNVSEERKTEAGRKTEKTENRQRVFERKEVCHHGAHSVFGKSSSPHTHYTIFRITRTEQRTVRTDFDGKTTYSDWLIVPGSENKQEVGGGMEGGHTAGYEREIA